MPRSFVQTLVFRETDGNELKGTVLSAYLVESYCKDGEPRQRIVKYLGSVGETYLANRAPGAVIDFWDNANKALAELKEQGLRAKDINQIRQSLSTKIKPPNQKEKQEINEFMSVLNSAISARMR